jgi:hypothetical protein
MAKVNDRRGTAIAISWLRSKRIRPQPYQAKRKIRPAQAIPPPISPDKRINVFNTSNALNALNVFIHRQKSSRFSAFLARYKVPSGKSPPTQTLSTTTIKDTIPLSPCPSITTRGSPSLRILLANYRCEPSAAMASV